MKRILPLLFSFYLGITPSFAYGQELANSKLEQIISKEEINEIRRKGAFSEANVAIVRVKVVDSESKCFIDDAFVELKQGNKRILSSYPIAIGKQAFFYPYIAKAEDGVAVFSVKRGHEGKLTKICVTHPNYRFFEAEFPLAILLQHINNPQSSQLPDSISQKLKFKYFWDEAAVFAVDYQREYRDYEAVAKAEEFIKKVTDDEIERYIDNIFGRCFYADYIGDPLMYLPPPKELHILIPIEVNLKKIPIKIEIERNQP